VEGGVTEPNQHSFGSGYSVSISDVTSTVSFSRAQSAHAETI
jgi:hypothetical protein